MPFDSIIDILEVKACTNVEFLEKIKEHFIKEIQKKNERFFIIRVLPEN